MSDSPSEDAISSALARWKSGDSAALDELLGDTLSWLNQEVGRTWRSSPHASLSTEDLVQSAVMKFLEWSPKFQPRSRAQFRALLKRIAMNGMIDAARRAQRRGARHVESVWGPAIADADHEAAADSSLSPSRVASRSEDQAWVRLALEFLEPEERCLILESRVEGREWSDIAQELGFGSAEAARRKAKQIEVRIAGLLRRLRQGQIPEAIG